jgi:hypothetical protein
MDDEDKRERGVLLGRAIEAAEANRARIDGSIASIERLITECDVVYLVWPDTTPGRGRGHELIAIKGAGLVRGIITRGETFRASVTGIPCDSYEQAVAIQQALGARKERLSNVARRWGRPRLRGLMTMDQIVPPPEGEVLRKSNSGNRTDRRNRSGRPAGARNRRTRETDELLAQTGSDAPHIALFKIGHDDTADKSLRVTALAHCGPFFAPRHAPAPALRFVVDPLEIGQLTDAASAVAFTAAVTEHVRAGKLDFAAGEFFLKAASLFAQLHERVNLEIEVERNRELRAREE